ncbi:uncharacterized protein LOC142823814 isoform X6 [Pelodiscus sinensis]|uniref:uncharacterized protein LOC142823814 isoform X6 n=1 Tax=Pelodiscus sinensis TaxID=13735 RepID=UPI003F6D2E20
MKRDGRAQWSRWDRPQQHGWLGSNGQIDAPAAQGGSPLCGMETIRLLQNITKLLGDTTDGMLYTPEDITVSHTREQLPHLCLHPSLNGCACALMRLCRSSDIWGGRITAV